MRISYLPHVPLIGNRKGNTHARPQDISHDTTRRIDTSLKIINFFFFKCLFTSGWLPAEGVEGVDLVKSKIERDTWGRGVC